MDYNLVILYVVKDFEFERFSKGETYIIKKGARLRVNGLEDWDNNYYCADVDIIEILGISRPTTLHGLVDLNKDYFDIEEIL